MSAGAGAVGSSPLAVHAQHWDNMVATATTRPDGSRVSTTPVTLTLAAHPNDAEDGVVAYSLAWGSNRRVRLRGYAAVGPDVPASIDDASVRLEAGLVIPAAATHLLVCVTVIACPHDCWSCSVV